MTPLQQAARNIILRWDSPLWKYQVHTAEYVNALRVAMEAEQSQLGEPVAWVKEDELNDLSSCNGRSIWAESPSIWFDEVPEHLVPVYKHSYPLLASEQAQAVEPVATVQCVRGVTIGYLDVMQPVGTKLYTHPAPATTGEQIDWQDMYLKQKSEKEAMVAKYERDIGPLARVAPAAAGERAELVTALLECLAGPAALTTREATAIKDAADMLEADAQYENLSDPAILHANLFRGLPAQLSKEQLIHLLGTDAKAQQVAVPMTEAQIFACDPVPHEMFDQQRIDFARAIEAFHGIKRK